MKRIAVPLLLFALLSGCNPKPNTNPPECDPPECGLPEGALRGGLEPGDESGWITSGSCEWGDGVNLTTEPTFSGASAALFSSGGCKITSDLVAVGATSAHGQRITLTAHTWRASDVCIGVTGAACIDVTVNLYDAQKQLFSSLAFVADGPRAGEWFAFEANPVVTTSAAYVSVTVGTFVEPPSYTAAIDAINLTVTGL